MILMVALSLDLPRQLVRPEVVTQKQGRADTRKDGSERHKMPLSLSPLIHYPPTSNPNQSSLLLATNNTLHNTTVHSLGSILPGDLLAWRIPRNDSFLTKTICGTNKLRSPFPILQSLFRRAAAAEKTTTNNATTTQWKFLLHKENSPTACMNSAIRVLWNDLLGGKKTKNTKMEQERILQQQHTGSQLTTSIVGTYISKSRLHTVIRQQATAQDDGNGQIQMLQKALPLTRLLNSTARCRAFCFHEYNNNNIDTNNATTIQYHPQQEWIWKPISSMQGSGIQLIQGSPKACLSHCHRAVRHKSMRGIQAQKLVPAMTLKDDGRKFDVRLHVVVANVHPLLVLVGAEKVRICVEPLHAMNATPSGRNTFLSLWNPFQHVCNTHIGEKHRQWNRSEHVGPLTRAFPNAEQRQRIQNNLDALTRALVHVLRSSWQGKVGMFQVLGVDYLVDKAEKPWLLEVNEQPAFPLADKTSPDPWPDVLRMEWEILKLWQSHKALFDETGNSTKHSHRLREILGDVPLNALRWL